ncbi:MAG: hypothetical protein OQL19_17090 [Gammaproteobacteria bacterium]|nr:hypothetical protein [Gammaproteobacteria bacterium]
MYPVKYKQLSCRICFLIAVLMITASHDIAFSDETISFDKVEQSPFKELDLSVNLDKIYNENTRPNFSGHWILEPSSSDNLKDVLGQVNKGDKTTSSRRSGDRSGRKGSGHKRGKRPSTSDQRNRNTELKEIEKVLVSEMKISHKEPMLRISSAQNGERIYYTDFRSSSISAMNDENREVIITGWEGDTLIIETTSFSEQKYIKKLKLLTKPHRIELTTELYKQDGARDFTQIKQTYLLKTLK